MTVKDDGRSTLIVHERNSTGFKTFTVILFGNNVSGFKFFSLQTKTVKLLNWSRTRIVRLVLYRNSMASLFQSSLKIKAL